MADLQIAERARGAVLPWSLIQVAGLAKNFGRTTAIVNLSFSVGEGEVVGLVGPTRSTVIDLLAGKLRPTLGTITIGGRDVSELGPETRHRHGLVRVKQAADLFMDLSALENIELGRGASPFFSRGGGGTCRDEAAVLLEFTGLAGLGDVCAGDLPPFEQRFLAIAVALAAKPSLLLLDALPVATMQAERIALEVLLANIRSRGISILIGERDFRSLTGICDRILVLGAGELIGDAIPSGIAPLLVAGHGGAPTALPYLPIRQPLEAGGDRSTPA